MPSVSAHENEASANQSTSDSGAELLSGRAEVPPHQPPHTPSEVCSPDRQETALKQDNTESDTAVLKNVCETDLELNNRSNGTDCEVKAEPVALSIQKQLVDFEEHSIVPYDQTDCSLRSPTCNVELNALGTGLEEKNPARLFDNETNDKSSPSNSVSNNNEGSLKESGSLPKIPVDSTGLCKSSDTTSEGNNPKTDLCLENALNISHHNIQEKSLPKSVAANKENPLKDFDSSPKTHLDATGIYIKSSEQDCKEENGKQHLDLADLAKCCEDKVHDTLSSNPNINGNILKNSECNSNGHLDPSGIVSKSDNKSLDSFDQQLDQIKPKINSKNKNACKKAQDSEPTEEEKMFPAIFTSVSLVHRLTKYPSKLRKAYIYNEEDCDSDVSAGPISETVDLGGILIEPNPNAPVKRQIPAMPTKPFDKDEGIVVKGFSSTLDFYFIQDLAVPRHARYLRRNIHLSMKNLRITQGLPKEKWQENRPLMRHCDTTEPIKDVWIGNVCEVQDASFYPEDITFFWRIKWRKTPIKMVRNRNVKRRKKWAKIHDQLAKKVLLLEV